ncbi:MAG: DUF4340 domain-containing protein [Planctomycetota bacterium]|jgi:hypothetical protein
MSEYLKTLIYVVVAAAFLALAWVARPAVPGRAVVDDAGELFFADFKNPLEAASLEIIGFDEGTGTARAFKVARHDGVWSIPSHENYAADAENRFAEAATALLDLAKGLNISDLPADHDHYGVVDPAGAGPGAVGVGTRVTIDGADGRRLADLIIGKALKDSDLQRYARVPGQDRVYLAAVDTEKFSTRFEDWIEKDLLQLASSDITGVEVRPYSVDELRGQLIQGEGLQLTFDNAEFEWDLEGLGEDEELDQTRLNDLRRAVDDLAIVDVHRKPAGLSSELRAEDALQLDAQAVQSLRSRGFYIHQGRLLSNQGETIIRMKDGVQYTLRFGEIVVTRRSGDEDVEAGVTDGTGRYLFVTADLNEDLVPKPDLVELPDMSHLIEPQEGEDPKVRPEIEEAIETARARAEQENQQKQEEYDRQLDAGRQRARELNDRFADWYYVISDEVYEKIRLRRDDVVKPAEPEGAGDAGSSVPSGG